MFCAQTTTDNWASCVQIEYDSPILCSCMHHCLNAIMYAGIPLPGSYRSSRVSTWSCHKCICRDKAAASDTPSELLLSGSERLAGVLCSFPCHYDLMPDRPWDRGVVCTGRQHTPAELQSAVQALAVLVAACLMSDPSDEDSV